MSAMDSFLETLAADQPEFHEYLLNYRVPGDFVPDPVRLAEFLPMMKRQVCALCNKGGATQECSLCGVMRYCGAACQRAHWQTHKDECRMWKTMYKAMKEEAQSGHLF
jgi:hypothetical protein